MLTTTAFCGGSKYRPTTSRILAFSSGSVENVHVSTRHGCTFHSRQIRATVATETPSSGPSSRDEECVSPSDAGRAAASTATSSWVAGRPDLGRSPNAASPPAVYRWRQVSTVEAHSTRLTGKWVYFTERTRHRTAEPRATNEWTT